MLFLWLYITSYDSENEPSDCGYINTYLRSYGSFYNIVVGWYIYWSIISKLHWCGAITSFLIHGQHTGAV
jgi:hypothetical protein